MKCKLTKGTELIRCFNCYFLTSPVHLFQNVVSDQETILCNSVKMIREKLSVSGDGLGTEHREKEDDYVYDLYYQETVTPGWIQDILSVRPYTQEDELVSFCSLKTFQIVHEFVHELIGMSFFWSFNM